MTRNAKKITANLSWVMLENIAMQLLGIAVLAILSRVLQPAEFGVIALAIVFTELSSKVATLGLGRILVARDSASHNTLNTAFFLSFTSGLVLCLLLITLAPWIGSLLDSASVALTLHYLSINLFFGAMNLVP